MKKIVSSILLVILIFSVCACGEKVDTTQGTLEDITFKETEEKTNYVKITMTNNDLILLELYPDIAPITVANFQKLVSEKFYDGLIFHRVIKDFMIQGGDPEGNGTGGSKETIKGEFGENGFTNLLEHKRGVLSMARAQGNDTASSQFFIVHKDTPNLNGKYAAFGKVIAGMGTVDKIAQTKTDSNDKPQKEQKMKTVRFITIEK